MKTIILPIVLVLFTSNAFAKDVKETCRCKNELMIDVFTLPIHAYEVSIKHIDKALKSPIHSRQRLNSHYQYETNLDLWKSKLRCMQILRDLKADLLDELNICWKKSNCDPEGLPKKEDLKADIDDLGKKILYYRNIIRTSRQSAGEKLRRLWRKYDQ